MWSKQQQQPCCLDIQTHEKSFVLKLTRLPMKFSFIIMARIFFHSGAFSPRIKQMASKATLTMFGGLLIVLTSTRCCFLINLTAKINKNTRFIQTKQDNTYKRSSVLKLTIVEIKFSRMMIPRMAFQSSSPSPRRTQIDSMASLTAWEGLAKDRTSTRCCFLMDFTAGDNIQKQIKRMQTILCKKEK